MSLVYDRSDQHQTIYDSYNAELAAKKLQSQMLQSDEGILKELHLKTREEEQRGVNKEVVGYLILSKKQ